MSIVFATTTYLESENTVRFQLIIETLRSAKRLGYPVIIVDTSSDPRVAMSFRNEGALVYPLLLPGAGPALRQAFTLAGEYAYLNHCQAIVRIPAESYGVIDFARTITEPLTGPTKIVIPSRTERSWESYPSFLSEMEKEINRAYELETKLYGFDPMFGVVAFVLDMLPYFTIPSYLLLKNELEDIFIEQYSPLMALASEKESGDTPLIQNVPIHYIYPPKSYTEDTKFTDYVENMKVWERELLVRAYRTLGEHIRKVRTKN